MYNLSKYRHVIHRFYIFLKTLHAVKMLWLQVRETYTFGYGYTDTMLACRAGIIFASKCWVFS